jgi:hypothetical protein
MAMRMIKPDKPVNGAKHMTKITANELVLCRSDEGNGGWSLHAPDSTDYAIATGDAPYLASGPATHINGNWDRPNAADYREALAKLLPIRATTKQIRDHYKAQGFEVRINRANGFVSYRVPLRDALWLCGRYVSEYRLIDGNVVLT